MKNKIRNIFLIIFVSFFITSFATSQELNFQANSIELVDKDQRIIAKKNIKIFNENETIYADEMDYDKSKQVIKAYGNIRIENLNKNIEIFSDQLIYNKNEEKIFLNKNIKINLEKKIIINTEEIVYDKLKDEIIVDVPSNFKDYFGNKFRPTNQDFC